MNRTNFIPHFQQNQVVYTRKRKARHIPKTVIRHFHLQTPQVV